MQLTHSLMNSPIPRASTELNDGNDSFMNILNERMGSKNVQRPENSINKAKQPMNQKNGSINNTPKRENEIVKTDKAKNPVENRQVNSSDSAKDSKAVKSKETTKVDKNHNENKPEKEERIESLEAMIALLEELFARLDIKVLDDATPVFSIETSLPVEDQGVSPMELLSLLVSQNIEKLKEFMGRIDQESLRPETVAVMEKVADLLEKLNGQNVEAFGELLMDDSVTETSGKDLISQMRAEVSQLIEKLEGQIEELKDSLNSESEDSISVNMGDAELQEVAQVEMEHKSDTQTESRDSDTKSAQHVEEDVNIENPIQHENSELFNNYITPDNNVANEPINAIRNAEKPQEILSQRPLEQTVTNQVSMKIKLMSGENKQEVEMNLKPDSLGKLSLKIVHERGEVLAKFTAENQQVKEILESNMQLLKDALENSGLAVQNLSVSVGDNNTSSKNNEGKNLGRPAKGVRGSKPNGTLMADQAEIRAKIEKEHIASQINLTA